MKRFLLIAIALFLGSVSFASAQISPPCYTTTGSNCIPVGTPSTSTGAWGALPVTGTITLSPSTVTLSLDTLVPATPAAGTATQGVLMGCQYLATDPSYTDTWQGGVRCDQDGALIAYAPPISLTGNITTQNLNLAGTATSGSAVEISLDGRSAVSVQVTGTWTGTIIAQTTNDGTNWISQGGVPLMRESTGGYVGTIVSGLQDIWSINATGHKKVRFTASAAMTGTAVVTLSAAPGMNQIGIGYNPGINASMWGSAALGAASAWGTAPTGNVPGVNANILTPVTAGSALQANSTPTVQAAAYPSGSCIGGFNAVTVTESNGQSGFITNFRISSLAGATNTITVYLFDSQPTTSTCTDKSTFNLSSTDINKLIASPSAITLAIPTNAITPSSVSLNFTPPLPFKAGGSATSGVKTIYYGMITSAVTPSSVSDFQLRIGAALN